MKIEEIMAREKENQVLRFQALVAGGMEPDAAFLKVIGGINPECRTWASARIRCMASLEK